MNIHVIEHEGRPRLVIVQVNEKIGVINAENHNDGTVFQCQDSKTAEAVFYMMKNSFEQ